MKLISQIKPIYPNRGIIPPWVPPIKFLLKFYFLIFLLLISIPRLFGLEIKKAVVITLDGWRADTFIKSLTPFLSEMGRTGQVSTQFKTVLPSLTLPAHTSLFTGKSPEKHGVLKNYFDGTFYEGETLFSFLKSVGKKAWVFPGKEKLLTLFQKNEFLKVTLTPDQDSRDFHLKNGINDLEKFDFLFFHLPYPDHVGHSSGWMNLEYLESVKRCDQEVQTLLRWLGKQRSWEHPLVLITSDHGGIGTHHISQVKEVTQIPLLIFYLNKRLPNLLKLGGSLESILPYLKKYYSNP